MPSWPHAPSRQELPSGAYIVTAGTYGKLHFFNTDEKLSLHLDLLFACAEEFGWRLEAWAVMSNHYHFVGHHFEEKADLAAFLGKLHSCSSRELNRLDGVSGRKVWFNCIDTQLSFEKSYLARLNYVQHNPTKHGLVLDSRQYRWCSADWFFRNADQPFYKTVSGFRIDDVNVPDDY